VQLINATTGEHLWSEHYDRPMTAIFTTLDEIIRSIATTLQLQLTLWQDGWYFRKSTDNVEAYEYSLRAFEACCRYTKESNAKARELWEKAVELDPNYAEAYAFLAVTYFLEWNFQWSHDSQALQRASQLAQQAIAMNEALPRAHWILGYVQLWTKQYDQAVASAKRAIALDPNFADGYMLLVEAFVFSGQPAEAVALAEKAMRLDPRYPALYPFELGRVYRLMGRYEDAIVAEKKAIAITSNFQPAHLQLAGIYSELGQKDEARAAAAEVLRINPNFSLEALKQMLPFKDPATTERFLAALRKAGLK
jgi:tetratricopeptide (TPR) repeat protein